MNDRTEDLQAIPDRLAKNDPKAKEELIQRSQERLRAALPANMRAPASHGSSRAKEQDRRSLTNGSFLKTVQLP